jgi:hypothetical protein
MICLARTRVVAMFPTLYTKIQVSMSCLLWRIGILLTVACRMEGMLGRIVIDSNETMLGHFNTGDIVNKVSTGSCLYT